MARVLFVDDRLGEVIRQWELSGCASNHELLPLEPFDSIERTSQMVKDFQPDVVLVGYGLGKSDVTGRDVVLALRNEGYQGRIIANSGAGMEQFRRAGVSVDGSANRRACDLLEIMGNQGRV